MTDSRTFHKYRALLKGIFPTRAKVILLITLLIIENVFALLSPWFAGRFSQSLLQGDLLFSLGYQNILLLWLVVICCQSVLTYWSRTLNGGTAEQIIKKLRTLLYDQLQSLHVGYFYERKHGELLSLFSHDTPIVGTFISSTLISLIPNFLTALGALGCIFYIDVVIGMLILLLVPLVLIATRLLGRSLRPLSRRLIDQHGKTFTVAEENIATLSIIKSFCQEENESRKFKASSEELYQANVRYIKAQATIAPFIRVLTSTLIILTLYVVSDQITTGGLSAGNLVSLILYGLLLTRPLSSLADSYGQFQKAFAAANRIGEVLSHKKESKQQELILKPFTKRIVFEDITFSYTGRDSLFEHLNLTIDQGETIAITGPNGSGKSSLAHLLMLFFKPINGRILLDDVDISSINQFSLRSQIGLVQQNVLLRNGTIRENLMFAKPEATPEEINRCTEIAQGLDFIKELPQGFETIIGDQGVKLSGGQKQRLALARALLKKPAILILDEATAMFDPTSELKFISDNEELLEKITVIIITHRPATLKLADRVLELQAGQLTQIH